MQAWAVQRWLGLHPRRADWHAFFGLFRFVSSVCTFSLPRPSEVALSSQGSASRRGSSSGSFFLQRQAERRIDKGKNEDSASF